MTINIITPSVTDKSSFLVEWHECDVRLKDDTLKQREPDIKSGLENRVCLSSSLELLKKKKFLYVTENFFRFLFFLLYLLCSSSLV